MLMEWKTLEFSWGLMYKHENRGLGEDGRSLKQMSHKIPLKKLIWKFLQEAYLRNYSQNFSWVSLTRKTVAKLSVQSWKNFKIGPFNSQLNLYMK